MRNIAKPQLQVAKFTNFITSSEAISAISTVLITPAILNMVTRMASNSSILAGHVTLTLVIASIVVFVIAGMLSGVLRSVALGVSVGLFINALLTVNAISGLVSRVGSSVRSS